MRVLFFVEGFTDIRFLVGLSEICELTVAVPSRAYRSSGLVDRVAASGARFHVDEIAGGRAAFSSDRCDTSGSAPASSTSCWRRRCCAARSTPRWSAP